ncbi:glycosyltransferase [Enterobacteriaceae bacterium]
MEKFSVLLSLYYKEKPQYLNECLMSLSNQTMKADEVVIVIDGQINQELKNIIQIWRYKLPLVVIPLEKNVGLGNALNIGLNSCSYRIVARMDTDDISLSKRFEIQLKEFSKNKNLALVGTNVQEYSVDLNEKKGNKKVPITTEQIRSYSIKRNPFNHMTVMFDKSKIIRAGGYQHHPFMEDYNLWLRCIASQYEMINIDDQLVHVRAGNEMVARRKGLRYIKSEYTLLKLKLFLRHGNIFNNFFTFVIRSVIRILPVNMLQFIYNKR